MPETTRQVFVRIVHICSGLLVGLALVILFGRVTGAQELTRVNPAWIETASSAAIGFLTFAILLQVLVRRQANRRALWFVRGTNFLIVLFGIIAWLGTLLTENSMLPVFAPSAGEWSLQNPFRTASPTATFSFLLASLALLLFTAPAPHVRIHQIGAGIMGMGALINVTVVLSYLYGSPFLYDTPAMPMSFLTAFGLLIFSVAQFALAVPSIPRLQKVFGQSVRAQLLRTFLPAMLAILVIAELAHSWLNPLGSRGWALWTTVVVLVASMIAVSVSWVLAKRIGGAIDAAEAARREQAEKEERARLALAQSQERWRALFDKSATAIALLDLHRTIVQANVAMEHLLGSTPGDLIGKPLTEWSVSDEQENKVYREMVAGQRTNFQITQAYRRKNGDLLWGLLTCTLICDVTGKPEFIVAMIEDLTERVLAEQELRRSEDKFAQAFRTSLDAISISRVSDGAFIEVNQGFCEITGYASGEIIGHTSRDLDLWSNRVERERMNEQLFARGEISGFETEFRTRQGTRVDGLVSARIVQINGAPHVLTMVRDISERKQRERETQSTAQVSAALRHAASRADMAPIIFDQLEHLLEAETCALIMREETSGDGIIELTRGVWNHAIGRRIPAGQGVVGRVFNTGTFYLTNDLQNDSIFYWHDLRTNLQTYVAMPLVVQSQVLGLLAMARQTPILPSDLRILSAIADMMANAMHRATLHEQTERRLEYVQALHSVGLVITASLDLRLTLDALLEQVTSRLNVDAADILLYNPYLQTLQYAAGRGFRNNTLTPQSLRLGQGYAGRAAHERQTVSLANLEQHAAPPPQLEKLHRTLAQEGFQAYYGVPLIAKSQVKGVLEIFNRAPLHPNSEWSEFLELMAVQAAIAIDNAQLFDGLQKSNLDLTRAYDATIEGWSRALDLRDEETEGHTQRVLNLTMRLANTMGLSEQELVNVRRGALLHDIGKMAIPDSILLKPGPLTESEWEIMRRHPEYARDLLAPIPYLRAALDIPYAHHEKWDGTGYPRGLRGEQIPLSARIFAVVDVWDALCSDRPYRGAWQRERVSEYIRAGVSSHFDPHVVEIFSKVILEQ